MPERQVFHSLRNLSRELLLRVVRFVALLGCITACANGLTLEWDSNPEAEIAGYKLHYGTASGQLFEIRDVGQNTSCVLNDLEPDTTYYFAVQAYNAQGFHSGLSSEISWTTTQPGSGVLHNTNDESMSGLGDEIEFGIVNPGAIGVARSFTFTNSGTNTLTNLTFSLGGSASGDFRISGDSIDGTLLSPSLEPGRSVTFEISFCPAGAGFREAFLKLAADQTNTALFQARLSANGSTYFESWLEINGASGGADGNPDGDALNNLFEYAFGTNPRAAQAAAVTTGTGGVLASRGAPGVRVLLSPAFEFRGLFARRKDHEAVGLIYRSQFSADLTSWVDATATPVVEGADDEIQAVSVKAPDSINGQTPRFFRVAVMRKGALSLPAWLAAHGTGGGAHDNPDGDGLNNLFEFAFGTDPAKAQSGMADENDGLVMSRGAPTARILTQPDIQFSGVYCRRKDRDVHGLIYMPQFSADLTSWVDSPYPSVPCADDGEIEVLSARPPDSIHGRPARFFRVAVSIAP